jgi:hypothetical protein
MGKIGGQGRLSELLRHLDLLSLAAYNYVISSEPLPARNAFTLSRPTSNHVKDPRYVPLSAKLPPQPWSWLFNVNTILRQGYSPLGVKVSAHLERTSSIASFGISECVRHGCGAAVVEYFVSGPAWGKPNGSVRNCFS